MVDLPVILLLVKEIKIYVLKRTKIYFFKSIIILNVDSSLNIYDRLLKSSVVIIDMIMDRWRGMCLRFLI